jgi:hypothetical protein
MREWFHVNDKMPPKGQAVLGVHSEWHCPLVVAWNGRQWQTVLAYGQKHWMPLNWSQPLHWSYLPKMDSIEERE